MHTCIITLIFIPILVPLYVIATLIYKSNNYKVGIKYYYNINYPNAYNLSTLHKVKHDM